MLSKFSGSRRDLQFVLLLGILLATLGFLPSSSQWDPVVIGSRRYSIGLFEQVGFL